jgi:putative aminopeptidase FrvX
MDDRASVTAVLELARRLRDGTRRPAGDVDLVFTTNEEIGGLGTSVAGGPIVGYSDAQCVYDTSVADQLVSVATGLDLSPQPAVLDAFESDASHAKAGGLTPRAALPCLPTLSTHGYEVIRRDAIPAMRDVLVEFLLR